MARPVLSLAGAANAPPRDPLRDDLRAAIARAALAARTLDAARQAESRAEDNVATAEAAVQAAASEVQNALGARASETMAAMMSGRPVAADGAIGAARLQEMHARDELEVARAVLARLQASTPDIEATAKRAREDTARAARQVALQAVEPAVARAAAAWSEFDRARAIVHGALSTCFRNPADGEERRRLERIVDGSAFNDPNRNHSAPEQVWRAALNALAADPNAALPE